MEDLAQVAVPAPLPDPLSYRVPPALAGRLALGVRVRVPLGSRQVVGVVTALGGSPPEGVEIKTVIEALDEPEHPALPEDLLATVLYGARYYLAPPGEMARAALPAALASRGRKWVRLTEVGRLAARDAQAPAVLSWLVRRPGARALEKTLLERLESVAAFQRMRRAGWLEVQHEQGRSRGAPPTRRVLFPAPGLAGHMEAVLAELRGAPAQQRALRAALDQPGRTSAELARAARTSGGVIAALLAAGRLVEEEREVDAAPLPELSFPVSRPVRLSDNQQQAQAHLNGLIDRGVFRAVLLYGITGSGKTEVYLRAAEHTLKKGRPVLFLVPEIGLTPKLAQSLAQRFGDEVSVLHSGLSDRQRFDAWQRSRKGTARVVVGARSALFAPLLRPGLIVVDEEHDGGYKQEEGARYHARDLALVRGREASAVVLLGSATPSLEAWELTRRDKADLLRLPTRVGGAALAEVELVDMRKEFREVGADRPLSRRLVAELAKTLERGEQAMVLLNRRGYTRVLHCRACGEAVGCPSCSISLTWHKEGLRRRCHYCGHHAPRPETCPSCASPFLADLGYGTQRAEEALRELLPGARIARLDRDIARSARRLAELLDGFSHGAYDVLVGTQMIAKGHHFPRVTLVGVLSADMSLALPDFRAGERTFQLLTQVAGRAGRGDAPGRVIVQAFRSDHPALRAAIAQDYDTFLASELPARELMHYPPATALANLIVQDREQPVAFERAARLADAVRLAGAGRVVVLGPTSAPLARLRGLWRVQLLVRAERRGRIADALRQAIAPLRDNAGNAPRWLHVDIDPQQLL